MSSQLPLGFQFNLGRNASGGTNRASFRDCSNYLFVVDTPVTGSTITFTEANATTGGTSQVLANGTGTPIVTYYTQTAGVWSAVTTGYVVATGILTITGTFDQVAVWVNQGALSDGFSYIQAVHSAKATTYIACPLDVMRKPTILRNIYA
jgi:Na+/proline symporter